MEHGANFSHLNSQINNSSWYSTADKQIRDISSVSCHNPYNSVDNNLVNCEMTCAGYSISSGSKPLSLIIRRCSTPANGENGLLSDDCTDPEVCMNRTVDRTSSTEEERSSPLETNTQPCTIVELVDEMPALHYVDPYTNGYGRLTHSLQNSLGWAGVPVEVSELRNDSEKALYYKIKSVSAVNALKDSKLIKNHCFRSSLSCEQQVEKVDSSADIQISKAEKHCQASDKVMQVEKVVTLPTEDNILDRRPKTDSISTNNKYKTIISSNNLRFNTEQSQYSYEQSSANKLTDAQIDCRSEVTSKFSCVTSCSIDCTSVVSNNINHCTPRLPTNSQEIDKSNSLVMSADACTINNESVCVPTLVGANLMAESYTMNTVEGSNLTKELMSSPVAELQIIPQQMLTAFHSDTISSTTVPLAAEDYTSGTQPPTEELSVPTLAELMVMPQEMLTVSHVVVNLNSSVVPLSTELCTTNTLAKMEELSSPVIGLVVMPQEIITNYHSNLNSSTVSIALENSAITQLSSPLIKPGIVPQSIVTDSNFFDLNTLAALQTVEVCATNTPTELASPVIAHGILPEEMLTDPHIVNVIAPVTPLAVEVCATSTPTPIGELSPLIGAEILSDSHVIDANAPATPLLTLEDCATDTFATVGELFLPVIGSEVLIDSHVNVNAPATPLAVQACATYTSTTFEELFSPVVESEVLTDAQIVNLNAPATSLAVEACATNVPATEQELCSPVIEPGALRKEILNNSRSSLRANLSTFLTAQDCATNTEELSSFALTGVDLATQDNSTDSCSAFNYKPLPVSITANLRTTNSEEKYRDTVGCKSDLNYETKKRDTKSGRKKLESSSPRHGVDISYEVDNGENSPLLFSSEDEEGDNEGDTPSLHDVLISREKSRLAHLQELLSGVPPPPSVTIPQLSVSDMLKLLKDNQWLMDSALPTLNLQSCKSNMKPAVSLEEALSSPWPEVKSCFYHGIHYNLGLVSEELEAHSQRLQQRLVGCETATSCSVWTVTVPGTKRRSLRLGQGHSPGRRLSHLARRRNAFSIANVQLKAVQRRQVMVEVKKSERTSRYSQKKKKVPNQQDDRRQISQTKINSSKRALFQSPPQDKRKKTPSSSTSKSKRRNDVEISKVRHSRRALWPDSVNSDSQVSTNTSGSGRKRYREDSHTEPRKCPRNLFGGDLSRVTETETSQSSRPPLKTNSTYQNNTSERTNSSTHHISHHQKPTVNNFKKGFSSAHKKKLLWAVAEALRREGVGLNHPRFKPCATALAGKCRHHLQDLLGPQTPAKRAGSTSDRMLQIASTFAAAVVCQIVS